MAVLVAAWQDMRKRKLRVASGVLLGWAALLVFFSLVSVPSFQLIAGLIVKSAQAAGLDNFAIVWWTYWAPLPVSLLGFALSGWIVGRLCRVTTLLVSTASVVVVLAVAAGIDWNTQAEIPVPHVAFYYSIVPAFRFFWSAGVILVPVILLLTGVCMTARKHPHAM